MMIGIDLGTTNSLCAYVKNGEPYIIPNRLGEDLTPSVVSIDQNGEISVGKTAKEMALLYPETAARVFKRTMGTEKRYQLSGKEYSSEELSSFILKYLKEDAEHFLGEAVTEAVISVPAYFNDARRKATKRAGELAGLKVERIISEPTAAAIAYGIEHREENTKFLIFDLGGGTFDVSILELYHNILEVRAVAGDNFLGGEDFTNILVKMIAKRHEIDLLKLTKKELGKICQAAEACKMEYVTNDKPTYSFDYRGETISGFIPELEYEIECEPLLEKIKEPIKTSLSDAKIKIKDIDMVILVGGATKLPIIYRYVGKIFRNYPNNSVDQDKAVALGAAVQCAMKERKADLREVILTDICPFTLGTEVVIELEGNRLEGGHYYPIIERNSVIPTSKTECLYSILDDQKEIRIKVLQGESRFAENNLFLGQLVVPIPKAKAGMEGVEVTYTYDVNSILEIEVLVMSTGRKVKQILKMNQTDMTDEEVLERMETLSYLKIPPREVEANRLLLIRGERLYEECRGQDRQKIEYAIICFEDALRSKDVDRIAAERKKTEALFAVLQDEFTKF